MVTSTNHFYITLGPWHFGDFRNIFLPNIVEDQKNPYDFRSGLLAGTPSCYGKSGPGLMHYVHKKARCEPEIATFRTKTLRFPPGYTFKIGRQKLN